MKRFIPIFASVALLACILVPFAVGAETLDYSEYRLPDIESNFNETYGGFEKVVIKADERVIYFYAPKIGYNFSDGLVVNKLALCTYSDSSEVYYKPVTICNSGSEFKLKIFPFYVDGDSSQISKIDSFEIVYSTVPVYSMSEVTDTSTSTLLFAPPKPASQFNIFVKSVDMSPALSEVLGVLPVVLAVMGSYIALRKGIAFIGDIVKSA